MILSSFRRIITRQANQASKQHVKARQPQMTFQRVATFFWGKKKDGKEAEEDDVVKESDLQKMKNLRYLLDDALNSNKQKPLLLSTGVYPENKNKLTVVLELDEVLAHVFTPDDEEGYLSSPQRYNYIMSLLRV